MKKINQMKYIVFIVTGILFFPVFVFSRPGGGGGFSGGGGGGFSGGGGGYSGGGFSSSGGSGDGEGGLYAALIILPMIFSYAIVENFFVKRKKRVLRIITNIVLLILFLFLEYAFIGPGFLMISVVLAFVAGIVAFSAKKNKKKSSQTYVSQAGNKDRAKKVQEIDGKILSLSKNDPGFSRILFLDFVSSLYHKYHIWYGSEKLNDLIPFMPQSLIASGRIAQDIKYTEVVIGNIEIKDLFNTSGKEKIIVEIVSNYTMVVKQGTEQHRYARRERWVMERDHGVKTPEPKNFSELECPSCGAPVNFTDAGQCKHCNNFIHNGKMQWALERKHTIRNYSFRTPNLVQYSQEIGTNFPTVMQPNINSNIEDFVKKNHYPDVSEFWNSFTEKVVKPAFMSIYDAWEKQTWIEVRHITSDRLWESNQFWIQFYKERGLINKLDDKKISKIVLARADSDKFYEALTVRIYASCYDYVVDKRGKVQGGNRRKPRAFSEYWTFLRRKGVKKEDLDISNCPNCGAPTNKMGQSGICGYCNTKVNTGNFSWVLAIIAQDEVYSG